MGFPNEVGSQIAPTEYRICAYALFIAHETCDEQLIRQNIYLSIFHLAGGVFQLRWDSPSVFAWSKVTHVVIWANTHTLPTPPIAAHFDSNRTQTIWTYFIKLTFTTVWQGFIVWFTAGMSGAAQKAWMFRNRTLIVCVRRFTKNSSTPIYRNKYLFITTVSCCSHLGDILYYIGYVRQCRHSQCVLRAFSIEKSYAHDKMNEIVERILHLEETISISTQTSDARQTKRKKKSISKIYCSRLVRLEKKYWATKQTQRSS